MRPAFLGAALTVGWTVAKIISASPNNSRIAECLVRAAPLGIAGRGVAMAWPQLSAWLMRTVNDSLGGSAGLAGVAVNLTTGGELAAAQWLFAGLAILTVIGAIGSIRTVGL